MANKITLEWITAKTLDLLKRNIKHLQPTDNPVKKIFCEFENPENNTTKEEYTANYIEPMVAVLTKDIQSHEIYSCCKFDPEIFGNCCKHIVSDEESGITLISLGIFNPITGKISNLMKLFGE